MTSYVKSTNFTSKDTLPLGDPLKIVKGAEIDVEFNAIATAVASKADSASPTFTGTPVVPTASAGTNTTQAASTAFVTTAVTNERTATSTLTNKTLTSPTINGGSITGITDLAVADGGTGVSTIAANAVVLGNGTDPVQTVAPGTSGNVLTSNGTTWQSLPFTRTVTGGSTYYPVIVFVDGAGFTKSTSSVKQYSMFSFVDGTLNMKVRWFNGNNGNLTTVTLYSRIYVNGVAVGTEQSATLPTNTDSVFIHSDIDVSSGDEISVYLRASTTDFTLLHFGFSYGVSGSLDLPALSNGTAWDE